ncbi:hypothetical protein H310_13197 [Aphanomyces invadans]|uniref:Uncharacterized protein n=1 Tax=Aphanomyces invadans TaxID=157072 RepID=A0A024TET5_9STRA|nr:hypothetical protein H310_13197 [Aphanomyces invadans]ETV92514.1 hypothetical protein H310_13197 [Aphanomyces invadans]|eukprot:XP_008878821.1 hypothetical protein H310_13197 [Aphanomyces invadans]
MPAAVDNNAAAIDAASQRETIRAAFNAFDVDGNGRMVASELAELVTSLGGAVSSVELEAALRVLDKDSDGVIDLGEFERWWMHASDDLDGDGHMGQMEKALARLKELGQKRFHVDIHTACWNGDMDVVSRLVQADKDVVHAKDATEFGDLNTPLHYAAYQGHTDLCAYLMDHAKVDAVNAIGCTPLFFASQQDRRDVVELLLRKGGANARLRETEHHFSAVDVASSTEMLQVFRNHRPNDKPAAPSAPAISSAGPTGVHVTWRAPAPKPTESLPISGYKVKFTATSPSQQPPFLKLVGPHPTALRIDTLAKNTLYTVQVAAVTLHGASDYSAAVTVSTADATTVPNDATTSAQS